MIWHNAASNVRECWINADGEKRDRDRDRDHRSDAIIEIEALDNSAHSFTIVLFCSFLHCSCLLFSGLRKQ